MDPYKVLGIPQNATDEEVKNAYRALARKYHPDNYSPDNPLADLATEKMKEVNEAYDMIQRNRASGGAAQGGTGSGQQNTNGNNTYTGGSGVYYDIRMLLNQNRFNEADKKLKDIPTAERTADWHYLTAVILMRRGWSNDAMHELEIACQMDPQNQEYQRAKEMFNGRANGFGQTYYGDRPQQRQGGCDMCDFCTTLICLDCLCNCR